jgi:hypothetical protein
VSFGVAVGKGKAPHRIMVGGRQVGPFTVVPSVEERAIVDAVWVLIQEHKDLRRVGEICQPAELPIIGIKEIGAALHGFAGIADHGVHGKTAHPAGPTSTPLDLTQNVVCWAKIGLEGGTHIRGERGGPQQGGVRVVRAQLPIQHIVGPIVLNVLAQGPPAGVAATVSDQAVAVLTGVEGPGLGESAQIVLTNDPLALRPRPGRRGEAERDHDAKESREGQ